MQVIKALGNELTLSATPNTVSLGKCIRIHNANTTTKHVITVANAGGNIASFSVGALDTVSLAKNSTDTIRVDTGSDVFAVSISFAN